MSSPLSPTPNGLPSPANDRMRRGVLWSGLLLLLAAVGGLVLLVQRQTPAREQPQDEAPGTIPAPTQVAEFARILPATAADFVVPTASDPATAQLIARLFDESVSLKIRCQTALLLARIGTDDAVAALRSGLAKGPPYLNAAIAEGLGECTNSAAANLLSELAGSRDEIVARGAARGLALRGDAAAAERLGQLLTDAQEPLSVRTEAALALGDVKLPEALDILRRSATEIGDEGVLEAVLEGLGKRPFAETEEFFRSYLAAEGGSAELKAAAIEALGSAEGNVAPFLLNLLNHPDPDLRAAAAWALTSADSGDSGPQLAAFLKQEPDAKVRTRLYQALENGGAGQAEAVLALVQNETDPAARLAGLDFLAGTLRIPSDSAVRDFFARNAVPELKSTALHSADAQNRLASVIALGRAGVPEAGSALQEIAGQSTDPRVTAAARQALRNPRRQ